MATKGIEFDICFSNGYAIHAREDERYGKPHILVGWRENGKPKEQEFWIPVEEAHAVFTMLAAFSEELTIFNNNEKIV